MAESRIKIEIPSTNTTKKEEPKDPFAAERAGTVREVGGNAIWTISSCKPGFGVEQLRDDMLDTYWQSDGQLPHIVSIQFTKKTTVTDIWVYMDYKLDESYTPSRLSIRAGSGYNDIKEIEVLNLHEPSGWVVIPVKDIKAERLRTFLIQIAVISNHQNGRDTHIRQIKIHSPMECTGIPPIPGYPRDFCTVEFLQYSCIR